jgi:hypothetical protein
MLKTTDINLWFFYDLIFYVIGFVPFIISKRQNILLIGIIMVIGDFLHFVYIPLPRLLGFIIQRIANPRYQDYYYLKSRNLYANCMQMKKPTLSYLNSKLVLVRTLVTN